MRLFSNIFLEYPVPLQVARCIFLNHIKNRVKTGLAEILPIKDPQTHSRSFHVLIYYYHDLLLDFGMFIGNIGKDKIKAANRVYG